jgi:hypothetical protein
MYACRKPKIMFVQIPATVAAGYAAWRPNPRLAISQYRRTAGRDYSRSTIALVERKDVGDRQLDALLERLDRIAAELERLNRTTEQQEGFTLLAGELRQLNESLNALAYAALGQAPPRVRRRAG